MSERLSFLIGDSDTRLLGLVAALVARHGMLRKGGKLGGSPYFGGSDAEVLEMLKQGVALAETIALDDVPDLSVVIEGDKATILRLRDWVQALEGMDDESDDEPEAREAGE